MAKPKRKTDEQLANEMARTLLPAAQAKRREFVIVAVSNHTDAEQRHMIRSGQSKTIRRQPKLLYLKKRGLLNDRELLACEWYLTNHTARYSTVGITANYAPSGGSSRKTNFDHLPKTREQQTAYDHFEFARAGISRSCLGLFESVVLDAGPIGRRSLAFKIAVEQLLRQIEGSVEL